MPDLNNPITDALDEMISRGADHMTIEPGRYNELLINEQAIESSLPPMDADEVIADMNAIGIDLLTRNKSYLHFHEETQQTYKLRFLLRELPTTFFLTFTYRGDSSGEQLKTSTRGIS